MIILKILMWAAIVTVGLFILFLIAYFTLICIGEAVEEERKKKRHLEEYPDLSNFAYGRSWDPEHLKEFEASKREEPEG